MSIRCPDCDTALLHQSPEEGACLNVCKHVRFRWDSQWTVEYCGDWDHSGFEAKFLRLLEDDHSLKSYRSDYQGDKPALEDYFLYPDTIIDLLPKVEDGCVDEAFCMGYTAHYPMGGAGSAVLVWGIKHDEGYRQKSTRRPTRNPKANSRKESPRKTRRKKIGDLPSV